MCSLEFSRSLLNIPQARLANLPINLLLGRLAPPTPALRTVTRSRDSEGFIVTLSIIRPMIITGSINFRLHSACPILQLRCCSYFILSRSSHCSWLISYHLTNCCFSVTSPKVKQLQQKIVEVKPTFFNTFTPLLSICPWIWGRQNNLMRLVS